MNIPESTKAEYFDNAIEKQLVINFPDLGLTVDMEHIVYESMTLKESIFDGSSIEFVGCISSEFSVGLYGVSQNLKGQRIIASIKTEDTDPIRLFYGIVDSVEMEANHNKRKITAYDLLYTAGNLELAKWYKKLKFPISLLNFRNSLFNEIDSQVYAKYGIHFTQESVSLPNDWVQIKKRYNPSTLRSIDVIKSLCQINGVFGIVNRQGIFEYRSLSNTIDIEGAFPGSTGEVLYPPFNPGVVPIPGGITPTQSIPYYRGFDYQEFVVKPVEMVTIRQDEEDDGRSYGYGANNYIIQGNMFTYKLSKSDLDRIALNVYLNVQGVAYQPVDSENDGLPWVECGVDNVSYYAYDYEQEDFVTKKYYVFSRTLSGIQVLKDNYTADGEQDQRQFITDIGAQIDLIKKKQTDVDLSNYYDKDYIDDNYYDKDYIDGLDPGGGWSVESVSKLPSNPQMEVLYLIQGEVVVH